MATKKKKELPHGPGNALATWQSLNEFIVNADEETCQALLAIEKKGKKRKQFLLRVHSRLNKVRADRERKELTK